MRAVMAESSSWRRWVSSLNSAVGWHSPSASSSQTSTFSLAGLGTGAMAAALMAATVGNQVVGSEASVERAQGRSDAIARGKSKIAHGELPTAAEREEAASSAADEPIAAAGHSAVSGMEPTWFQSIVGESRARAFDVVSSLHKAISSDIGGTPQLRALQYLQAYTESLPDSQRRPKSLERLPQSEDYRQTAMSAAWYARLSCASYGSRGAMLFGACSVHTAAPEMEPARNRLDSDCAAVGAAAVGAAASATAATATAASTTAAAEAAASLAEARVTAATTVASASVAVEGAAAARPSDCAPSAAASPGWAARIDRTVRLLGVAAGGGDLAVFLAQTGLPASAVLHADFDAEVDKPAHVLVADHARGAVVLVVRGTISEADVMTDIAAVSSPFLGGYSHAAMARAATSLLCLLVDEGPHAMALPRVMREHPGYRFVVAGHSLGGGVATLLHLLLHARAASGVVPASDACWAFGAPPCFAPLDAVPASARGSLVQVVCGDDCVSRVCVWSLRRAARALRRFEELYPPRTIRQLAGIDPVTRPSVAEVVATVQAELDKEATTGTLSDIRARIAATAPGSAASTHPTAARGRAAGADSIDNAHMRLWVPGRILYVGRRHTADARLLQSLPAGSLRDIVLSGRMVWDHLPMAYVEALAGVEAATDRAPSGGV